MKTIEGIKESLYKHYPDVSPNLIDTIVEIYFKEGERCISEMVKPEIAFTWGTLILKTDTCKKKIKLYNTILENDEKGVRKVKDIMRTNIQVKVDTILKCLSIQENTMKEGKTSRSHKRKKQ